MSLRSLVIDTSWGPLRIAGGSRAGEGTTILAPQLRLALEMAGLLEKVRAELTDGQRESLEKMVQAHLEGKSSGTMR